MPWQDHYDRADLIKRIRAYAEKDLTMTQVAAKIGYGMNRHMVRGLANRAKPKITFGDKRREARRQKNGGVAERPLTGPRRTIADKARSQETRPVSVVAPSPSRIAFVILDEVETFDAPGPVHFDDLRSAGGLESGVPPNITDGRCRYPLWPDRLNTHHRPQPFEMMHCGKPVVPGTSWCPDCTEKVFMKVEPKPRPKRDRNGRKAGWEFGF